MKTKNAHTMKPSLNMSSFTLMLLAASCLTAPGIAMAQVDPANPATQVYTAPNGVPIVDITNPNASG